MLRYEKVKLSVDHNKYIYRYRFMYMNVHICFIACQNTIVRVRVSCMWSWNTNTLLQSRIHWQSCSIKHAHNTKHITLNCTSKWVSIENRLRCWARINKTGILCPLLQYLFNIESEQNDLQCHHCAQKTPAKRRKKRRIHKQRNAQHKKVIII